MTDNQLVVREPQLSSRASAARKAAPTVAAPDHCALVDSARAHHGKSCKAVTEAEAGVKTAKAALEAAPRDPRERAVAREALVMAEEDLEAAKTSKCGAEQRLQAAERARDEAEATSLGARVSRAAQMRALDTIAESFERHVVDGVRAFFADVTECRAQLGDVASALNPVLARLGHQHRVDGVDLAHGTGTEQIPPVVSLETLHAYSSALSRRLEQRRQSPQMDRLTRAALLFIDGALDAERASHRSFRELDILLNEQPATAATGGAR
ncbi:MAG TPA: hypothetical protein VHP33_10405 [Polyangiaceae bacterium]|nr:hypothetical protein [Polyangiaceae bacterium]